MKIGNVRIGGKVQAAVQNENRIIPMSSVKGFQEKYGSAVTDDIIRNPEMFQAAAALADHVPPSVQIDDGKISFAPVVMQPQKIICVGLNYRSHVEETRDRIPESPVLFSKYAFKLLEHHSSLPILHFSAFNAHAAPLSHILETLAFAFRRMCSQACQGPLSLLILCHRS